MTAKKEDAFTTGGILAVLGLYLVAFSCNLQSGFFLLGVGIVIMSSTSEEFRERLFDFFLSTFRILFDLCSTLITKI